MYVGENVRLPLYHNGIWVPGDMKVQLVNLLEMPVSHRVLNSSTYVFMYQYLCLNVSDMSFLVRIFYCEL